jgi:hypothetical protein
MFLSADATRSVRQTSIPKDREWKPRQMFLKIRQVRTTTWAVGAHHSAVIPFPLAVKSIELSLFCENSRKILVKFAINHLFLRSI